MKEELYHLTGMCGEHTHLHLLHVLLIILAVVAVLYYRKKKRKKKKKAKSNIEMHEMDLGGRWYRIW